MRLVISHSSVDADLVKVLVELVRLSLSLPAEEIRGTSVDGSRLPGGADAPARLRKEIAEAPAFVFLLTPASRASAYVLMEVGARWGTSKRILPLVARGIEPSEVPGPISHLTALDASKTGGVHQLVTDLAEELQISASGLASYEEALHKVVKLASDPSPGTDEARADHKSDGNLMSDEDRILMALVNTHGGSGNRMTLDALAVATQVPGVKARIIVPKLVDRKLLHKDDRSDTYGITDAGTTSLADRDLV